MIRISGAGVLTHFCLWGLKTKQNLLDLLFHTVCVEQLWPVDQWHFTLYLKVKLSNSFHKNKDKMKDWNNKHNSPSYPVVPLWSAHWLYRPVSMLLWPVHAFINITATNSSIYWNAGMTQLPWYQPTVCPSSPVWSVQLYYFIPTNPVVFILAL